MFLSPLALALLVVGAPIILMYMLRLRRRERTVASTLLWQRALEDVQANRPWQRPRLNTLLILQLLALLILVLALAQPAYTESRAFSGDIIVILDQSYAMQAHDVAPSRFGAAQTRAKKLADNLNGGSVMSVIGMATLPHLAIAESNDSGAIGNAISHLSVTNEPPNFVAALSLATSLARAARSTRIIVLTSRESGIEALPMRVPFPVTLVRLGGHLHDLGIVDFQADRAHNATQAVLRVRNFGSATASSDLNLYTNGELADVRPLTLKAGEEQNLVWTDLPAGAQQLHAVITGRDDIEADRSAWAVLPTTSLRTILLVSPGDYFLQSALAIDPSIQLESVSPVAYAPAQAQGVDLVIFDGFVPRRLPATSTLIIAPPSGRASSLAFGRQVAGGSFAVAPSPAPALSPILRYVDLSDVHVASVRATIGPSTIQTLAFSGRAPALLAGTYAGTRIAVVPFDLQQSDWPLRLSFPVAVQNIVHYLAPGLTLGAATVQIGARVPLYPAPGTREVDVTRPDKRVDRLFPPFQVFSDTAAPGLYALHSLGVAHGASTILAVNSFHPRVAPVSGPSAITFGHASSNQNHPVSSSISLAWIFGLAALALVLSEWWFGFRR